MDSKEPVNRPRSHRAGNNVGAGLIFLIIGGTLLLRQLGVFFPDWVISWQMLLIMIGLFIGFKNGFSNLSWLPITAIGGIFLIDEIIPDIEVRRFAWPLIIIAVGLFIMLSSGRHGRLRRWSRGRGDQQDYTTDVEVPTPLDWLDIVSIFGSIKKTLISKSFSGGDVVCIFGGADINLLQADITKPVVLDVVQIFGGTKLRIPPNWEVSSESAVIFGGIEEKRTSPVSGTSNKVIIIKGTTIFGGIEIISY